MADEGAVVVVGGTRAIGFEIAKHYVEAGREVVLTGQSRETVDAAVAALDGRVTGLVFDLAEPGSIAPALAAVGPVHHLVLVAIDRDQNSIRDYDIAGATRLTTLKLVGYAEVVHALLDRLDDVLVDRHVRRPGAVPALRRLDHGHDRQRRGRGPDPRARPRAEADPRRTASTRGSSATAPTGRTARPRCDATRARTPTGRLVTMADIVAATAFLLESPALNGVELRVDGGLHAT